MKRMIDRHILQIVPSRKSTRPSTLSVNHLIAITDDGKGVAKALSKRLNALGYHQAQVVEQIPPATDVVIALDGLADFSQVETAIACNRTLFRHARLIADRFTQKGGVFVTVQTTGGRFGLSKTDSKTAWAAGITGLTKTAAQEWPKAVCQAIDLQIDHHHPELIAEKIAQQLLIGHPELECGLLTQGEAHTTQLIPAPVACAEKSFHLDKKAVIVASGGARGITAACLLALARYHQPRIILLGRTALTEETPTTQSMATEIEIKRALIAHYQANQQSLDLPHINQQVKQLLAAREITTNLAELKAAGAEVLYFAVDILNAAALTSALTQARKQFGKITGILHGAGILADKLISQKTDQQFDKVFNTKVYGLKNLLDATRQDNINLLLLFSSVAGRFGNVGQCDYAMANEVLNKVAQQEQHSRGKKCLVKSFNWGPWEGGMVTPELKAVFQQRGVGLLPIGLGTKMFLNELVDASREQVEVVFGGTFDLGPAVHPQNNHPQIVNHSTYPFLSSHIINRIPVLPVCLVMEWFAASAQAFCPQLSFSSCRDFKVMKGVRLTNFYTSDDEFVVTCQSVTQHDEEEMLALKLLSKTGALHYSAIVTMRRKQVRQASLQLTPVTSQVQNWPCDLAAIYNDQTTLKQPLFQGKELQAIASLNDFSSQGGTGQVYTLQQRKWASGRPWQIDILTLEGVLQLLQLWGLTQLHYLTLPTAISEYNLYADHAAILANTATLQCTFNSENKGNYRTLSTAWLHDIHGQCYASLHGIEMCAMQMTSN